MDFVTGAYIKKCVSLADALEGWNVAEEGRDLAVMATEAAISRALTAEERILELEHLVTSLKFKLGTKAVRVVKVWYQAMRLVAAENREKSLETELQERAEKVNMSEATCLVLHTTLEKVESKLEGQNNEPQEKKVESQEFRCENVELKRTWRTRMVDKGVGALPRLQVCSVPVQTDADTIGVGVTVPIFVFGAKTWVERAAIWVPGGGSGVVPPPLTIVVPEVEIMDVGGTTSREVKGRKWSPNVINSRDLVIHEVSCNQGVAVLWSRARQLRDCAGTTVVGMRWLLTWQKRLQRTVS